MRIAEVIKLLASPFHVQRSILSDIPQNTNVPGFRRENDVYRMLNLYLDSLSPFEGSGGTEGEDHWRARTQIPADYLRDTEHPFRCSNQHLATALRLIYELDRPFLYTEH